MTDEITERTATLVSRSLAGGVTVLGILVAFEQDDASPSRLLVILVLTLLTGLLIRSSIDRRPTNVDRRAVLARNVPSSPPWASSLSGLPWFSPAGCWRRFYSGSAYGRAASWGSAHG